MINTAFLNRIRKMADCELGEQESRAYNIAYGESYGTDYEAKADRIQEYEALAREQKRRMGRGQSTRCCGGI